MLPGVPGRHTAIITCLETVVPTVLQMKTLTQDRQLCTCTSASQASDFVTWAGAINVCSPSVGLIGFMLCIP